MADGMARRIELRPYECVPIPGGGCPRSGGRTAGRPRVTAITLAVLVLIFTAFPLRRGGTAKAGLGIFEDAVRWMRKRVQRSRGHHHVFLGEVRKVDGAWRPSGYHHRFMGVDQKGRRVVDIDGTGPAGTYRGRVEMQGPDGQWYRKTARSSFFPDNWTPRKVGEAIDEAFANSSPVTASWRNGRYTRWRGTGHGITIEGSYKKSTPNKWDSGWPVI
jgi:hypothetical protein